MLVDVDVTDRVAVARLANTRRRNALSTPLINELHRLADRNDISAFVLTGNGPFFCAGADVTELATNKQSTDEAPPPVTLFRRITEDSRPWLAALNGPALGGGCELALACDFILTTPDAYLRLPEATLGVIPRTAIKLLAGTVHRHLALSLLLGKTTVTSDLALASGIAAEAHPQDSIVGETTAFARRLLATTSPTAFRVIKESVARDDTLSWRDADELAGRVDRVELHDAVASLQRREAIDYSERWQ